MSSGAALHSTRRLVLRGLADVCPDTLAVWLRRAVGPRAQADALSALVVLADDIVWSVQTDPTFVTDAARRTEAAARLRAQARHAGIGAPEHAVNLAIELTVAALKTARRMPPNAGA